jgi:pilus assembly protein CpaE
MVPQTNILLMTKDKSVESRVKAALDENKGMSLAGVCTELSELRINFGKMNPQVVVVDIDPDPSRALVDLGKIIAIHPEMLSIVVSCKYDNDLIMQAMQTGVRNYLEEKTITDELVKVVGRLVPESLQSDLGSVITVLSTSGGCGATTVTLNLANELRIASESQVMVVDLDSHYGSVSTYLGINGKYGIADVLTHNGEIDKHLIRSSACMYRDDFHVLASPAGMKNPEEKTVKHENLIEVIESCRQVYKYTIVDAPRITESISGKLLSVSDVILVVFQLTVKDVTFARSLIATLIESQVKPEKIMLLVNRFNKRNSVVSLGDWLEVLGVDRIHKIRSDWKKATKCGNSGRSLVEIAPRSGLRKDYRKLADLIKKGHAARNSHAMGK